MSKAIPEGYKADGRGALIPIENIREIDLLRDDLVLEIVRKTREMNQALRALKAEVFSDIEAFVALSGERYGVQVGGTKGNVLLQSFDGRYRVQRAIAEHIVFDERLQIAKELVDRCLHRWTEGSRPELRAMIDHAFQVDKQGAINTRRVLGLRQLKIEDEDWTQAMQAIADALSVVGSKTYFRVYERVGASDQYRPIPLDVAAV